jgi:hypothetical protein
MRRRRSRTSAKFGVTGLVVGVGVCTFVAVAWSNKLHQEPAAAEPEFSAADVVAFRFPYELEKVNPPTTAATDDSAIFTNGTATATTDTAPPGPDDTLALFNPYPIYPATTQSDAEETPSATPPQAEVPDATPAPVTNGTSELPTAATPRNSARPGAVLSEGQIASIKRRLKLTPQQQQMWPAVEVALRSLSYPKKSEGAHKNGNAIDKSEVELLTSAAYPLVMSFSDDQKRELHEIAHVAGLEQLVPKF